MKKFKFNFMGLYGEVSSVCFSIDEYNGSIEKLQAAIIKQITLLTEAGYVCTVREEELGIFVIEFAYSENKGFGGVVLRWLTPEEDEELENIRYGNDDIEDDAKDDVEDEEGSGETSRPKED